MISDSEESGASVVASGESSSEAESEATQPSPKKAKTVKKPAEKPKKNQKTNGKSKKKKSPSKKTLAKTAAKKGDDKSEKTIMELAEEAMRIESEAVGNEMEETVNLVENLFKKWMEMDVEEENIQRFAARILKSLQKFDIICSVDQAIFKREIGVVRLLEMELDDDVSAEDLQPVKERADKLLSLVVNPDDMERLDQTKQGTAWVVKSPKNQRDAILRKGKYDQNVKIC